MNTYGFLFIILCVSVVAEECESCMSDYILCKMNNYNNSICSCIATAQLCTSPSCLSLENREMLTIDCINNNCQENCDFGLTRSVYFIILLIGGISSLGIVMLVIIGMAINKFYFK